MTVRMVPVPVYQIPFFHCGRKIVRMMPKSTQAILMRRIAVLNGIAIRLEKYLPGMSSMFPVSLMA